MKGMPWNRGKLQSIHLHRFSQSCASDPIDDRRQHRQWLGLPHLDEFYISTELFDEVLKSFLIICWMQQALLQHQKMLGEIA